MYIVLGEIYMQTVVENEFYSYKNIWWKHVMIMYCDNMFGWPNMYLFVISETLRDPETKINLPGYT